MVSVEEAQELIFSSLWQPSKEKVSIEECTGRVLAEEIRADRDFPPFNRVTMDGVALLFSTWSKGTATFRIEGTAAAGEEQRRLSDEENCIEVMTGAMLPGGTDTVIRYEDLEISNGMARVNEIKVEKGQSIHSMGSDAKAGDVLLPPGTVVSPAEVALMASVGKTVVEVYTFPATAVISTGNELVSIDHTPDDHQIRQSNVYALTAAMKQQGWKARKFHLPDNEDILRVAISEILQDHDLLILSGGVSKGKYDFIPAILEEAGIRKVFHQVRQRPGKPFYFGISSDGKTAFALPGNPVSTYMCFYRYILPWIRMSLNLEQQPLTAVLTEEVLFPPPLTYFLQVATRVENGVLRAAPVPGGGSGDFANLGKVTGFLELPASRTRFTAGETFPYYAFRPVG